MGLHHRVGEGVVDYVEHGSGVPLVALHGAGVDHREIEAAIEAVAVHSRLRRIYPDLPGMGGSSAEGLVSNDDVVTLLVAFLEQIAGGPALLLGHSYGGYLARGVAARRPDLVSGLCLICPVGDGTGTVPAHAVVHEEADAYDELMPGQREGFDDYVVLRTRETARRYRDHVVPGTVLVDEAALGRIFSTWSIELGPDVFTGPTLVVAGRCDSSAGYLDAVELLEHYPRATLAVVEGAGHALMHERPKILAALLDDWTGRVAAHKQDPQSTGLARTSPVA